MIHWIAIGTSGVNNASFASPVVSAVTWECRAEQNNLFCSVYGSLELRSPKESTFIEYNQVTGEILSGWIVEQISAKSKATAEKEVAAKLADAISSSNVVTKINNNPIYFRA